MIAVAYRRLKLLSSLVDADLDEAVRARIDHLEEGSGLASAAMAVQNLLLAAHAGGLGDLAAIAATRVSPSNRPDDRQQNRSAPLR